MQKITREEFAKKYGQETLNQFSFLQPETRQKTNLEKFKTLANKGGEFAQGVVQSALGTVSSLGQFVGGQTVGRLPGVDLSQSGAALDRIATPTSKAMQAGKTAGNIAQFVSPSPAGKTSAAVKSGSLLSKLLGRAGGARFLATETAKDAALSAAQSSPDTRPSDIATGVGIGAALNVLLPNVITESRKLFRQSVKNSASRIPATVQRGTANGLDVLEANVELVDAPVGARTPQATPGGAITLADNPGQIVSTSARRAEAESLTPQISIKEKILGIDPDLKQTLQSAGPELTQEYIDVVKTRNQIANFQDGTPVPTALAHATGYVDEAAQSLARKLSDQGGEIGQFRNKISTYKASSDQVKQVTSTFENALSRYNLTLNKQNQIVPVRGKISRAGAAEINTLQRMYDNLQTVSQAPNVENLIEARVAFDELVNFASKEPTFNKNIVQDVSKATRSSIADVNRQIVGKSEAAKLQRYTEMVDALSDLTSYTDRRAGAEFILKRVLSERDRETREILQRIKEETGIDLFEHATLARVTTDFMANQRQKGLFRQEITSAGGDIAAILSGDKVGVLQRIIQRGLDAVTDEEEIIRRAAMPSD